MLFPILTNVNITELICTIGPGGNSRVVPGTQIQTKKMCNRLLGMHTSNLMPPRPPPSRLDAVLQNPLVYFTYLEEERGEQKMNTIELRGQKENDNDSAEQHLRLRFLCFPPPPQLRSSGPSPKLYIFYGPACTFIMQLRP